MSFQLPPVLQDPKKAYSVLTVIALVILLPAFVFLALKQQDIRNRAANTTAAVDIPPDQEPPAPKPVDTGNYLVGAWYMPGWAQQNNCMWDIVYYTNPSADFTKYPKCGSQDKSGLASDELYQHMFPYLNTDPNYPSYPEEKRWVLDYQIKWALENGIKLFFFDWFWDSASSTELDQYKLAGQWNFRRNDGIRSFLESPYSNQMLFAVMLAATDQTTYSSTDAEAMVRTWATKYFNKPNYLKVDGKPVVSIFDYGDMKRKLGGDPVKVGEFLDRARTLAQTQFGLPGIYFMVNDWPFPEMIQQAKFDGTARYGYAAGGRPRTALTAPYDDYVTGFDNAFNESTTPSTDSLWKQDAAASQPYMVTVNTPLDYRAASGLNDYYTNPTPESFRYSLKEAKSFVDAYRNTGFNTNIGNKKIILIGAWNEFSEATALHPTKKYGFSFLEMVRQVFSSTANLPIIRQWIEDGQPHAKEDPGVQYPVLLTPRTISYQTVEFGSPNWTNYTVSAKVTPTFNGGDNHVGFDVVKNGNAFLYIYIQPTTGGNRGPGIYGQANINGAWQPQIWTFKQFGAPLALTGGTYDVAIDVWNGKVNVRFNGELLKTLNLSTFNSSLPKTGGVATYYYNVAGVTYNNFTVTSLDTQPIALQSLTCALSGPDTAQVNQPVSYSVAISGTNGATLATSNIYWGNLLPQGQHQETWNRFGINSGSITFAAPGNYWVMADAYDANSRYYSANPSYTDIELLYKDIRRFTSPCFKVVNVGAVPTPLPTQPIGVVPSPTLVPNVPTIIPPPPTVTPTAIPTAVPTALPTLAPAIDPDTKRMQDLQVIQQKLEQFKAANGFYPVMDWTNSSSTYNGWIPGITGLPIDPVNDCPAGVNPRPADGQTYPPCHTYAYYSYTWCGLAGKGYILATRLNRPTSVSEFRKTIPPTSCVWTEPQFGDPSGVYVLTSP